MPAERLPLSPHRDGALVADPLTRRGSTPATCSPSSTAPTRPGSRALLPAPLDLAEEDPGAVALIWADWQSCSSSRRGAAGPGPVAVQGGLRRRPLPLRGRDLLALRLHLGRQGLRHRPRHAPGLPEEARLDLADPAAPVRRRRRRRSGPAASSAPPWPRTTGGSPRRSLTLREESDTNGFVNGHPMAHHRVFPGIAPAPADAYAELISSGASRVRGRPGLDGRRRAAAVRLPDRGAGRLTVDEVIGGYYRQVGVVWDGGTAVRVTDADMVYARAAHRDPYDGAMPDRHTLAETERAMQHSRAESAAELRGRRGGVEPLSGGQRRPRASDQHRAPPHGLTWTGFVVLWVVWIWDGMETRGPPRARRSPRRRSPAWSRRWSSRGLVGG